MGKMHLAVIGLIALAFFVTPVRAESYNALSMGVSQSYLRLGLNDTITLTIHLLSQGATANVADVPVLLNFRTSGEYVVFDSQLVITDASGTGSATVRLSPDNLPERARLPLKVMIEAVDTNNDRVRNAVMIYIVNTGSIAGYVLNDDMSTITGANITVKALDGKPVYFPGGPFRSSDGTGTPMGYYRIDNLPVGLGRYTLGAEKGGYTGSAQADAGFVNLRQDIVIHGYTDSVNVTKIISGVTGIPSTPTPEPSPTPDTPAKPTSTTTTILIAIILITLVYIGLKAYRRMF